MQSPSCVFMVTWIVPLQGVAAGLLTGFSVLAGSSDTGCTGAPSITTGTTLFWVFRNQSLKAL